MTHSHEPPSTQAIQASLKQWQESAVLHPAVLDSLHEMNHAFLELLALSRDARAGVEKRSQSRDLIVAELAKLDSARRAAVARCPFSLFNARFHNGSFWSALVNANVVREPGAVFANAAKSRESAGGLAAFAETALFYAWHLVRANPLAAQLLLGMSEQTLVVFKRLSLVRLRRIAAEQTELIGPRWPDRTKFWQMLLLSSRPGAESRPEEMRLLGVQMITAEMAMSAHPGLARRPAKP